MSENKINYTELGRRVRFLREGKRWTQRDLGFETGLTSTHVSHIENGSTKPSLPVIVNIANVLGTTVDRLLCDSMTASANEYCKEFTELFSDCDTVEAKYLIDVAAAAKKAFRRAKSDVRNAEAIQVCNKKPQ